jgi:hypothetical protein
MIRVVLASVACLAVALPVAGQSNIQNARLVERPAGDLSRTFQQLSGEPGPLWIGYAVPAHSPDWNACCSGDWSGGGCCGRCALEERKGEAAGTDVTKRPIALEGTTSALILYRVERGRAEKVRTYSESCQIDAGGRTLYWLTDVSPAASVALLKNLLQPAGNATSEPTLPRHLVSEALLAITAHQAPEAVTTLIDLARNGAESRVRGDALFWLAQRAGEKAAGAITEAIANDPDTKVKERAVFALSQLPKDEGVPKLIDVARTNRNPRVRQQAVFWLGQSKDSRALAFFEEILLK